MTEDATTDDVIEPVSAGGAAQRRASTVDGDLADAIVRMVIMRPLPPGAPLRENEIANRFGVSRPTVRAALRKAATTGFVEITAFRGAHVRQLEPEDLNDLINLLEDIYGLAAREAARRRLAGDIEKLHAFLERFDLGLGEESEADKRIRLSFRFGSLVAAAAHAPFIQDALERTGQLVLWQQRLRFADVVWYERQSLEFHRLLAWAVEHRNDSAASDAARAIVRLTREALRESKIL